MKSTVIDNIWEPRQITYPPFFHQETIKGHIHKIQLPMLQAEKQQKVTFCYISSDFLLFITKDNSATLKKMSFKTRYDTKLTMLLFYHFLQHKKYLDNSD